MRRARVVVGVVVAAMGLLTASAPADARMVRPVPVVAPRVVVADVCDGTLTVRFDAARLAGRTWLPRLDDGHAGLALLERSGRSGPDGVWDAPDPEFGPVTSGGEGALRWAGWAKASSYGLHYVQARVTVAGYQSIAYPISEECRG